MLACLETEQLELTPDNLARRKSPMQILNTVVDEETGELMEMRHLMNIPKYRNLWGKSYGDKLGQL